MDGNINDENVGRIAERIVANELEFRGFRVSDVNKEGTAANVDLIAVKGGRPWQIQVKGASNKAKDGWWVGYGYCNPNRLSKPWFNSSSGFYIADVVVLVAVRSPIDYRCVIMPVEKAEEAVQVNLNREYRSPTLKGTPRKGTGYAYGNLDSYIPKTTPERQLLFGNEQSILNQYDGNWDDAFPG
jgi:hypothetical protein